MSQPIKQRLESSLSTAAPSGRAIASYMLANLYELPFQTAADIASKLGVSERDAAVARWRDATLMAA